MRPPSAKIVFVGGDSADSSSPSGGLAVALKSRGFNSCLVGISDALDTRRWLSICRGAAAIVLVAYDGPNELILRQLALATAVGGVPVVRWWVGTDVLRCISEPDLTRLASVLSGFSQCNVSVAPHLAAELKAIGISSQVIPSLSEFDPKLVPHPEAVLPRGVLAYLPTKRRDFYGARAVEAAIRAHPNTTFFVLADEDHTLAHYENVASLGWVSDMEQIWPRVGCVLRMTEHDGLPRMVLDALARGRYAIYRWPLAGCWQASNNIDVERLIARFQRVDTPNFEGVEIARQLATPAPSESFAQLLGGARRELRLVARLYALWSAARITIRWKLARVAGR